MIKSKFVVYVAQDARVQAHARWFAFLLALLTLVVSSTTWAAGVNESLSQAAATVPEVPTHVKNNVRLRVDNGYNAGIVVGVIDSSGSDFFGYTRPGDPSIDENTLFEIGSITKVFTSIILADMVGKGDVSLDDLIEKFLPETVVIPERDGNKITLMHLATHTSGLPRMPSNFSPADRSNPFADYTVEQMYSFLTNYSLTRDIGAEYEYSNLAVGLLGHILARITDVSYGDLVVSQICNELGMASTKITLTTELDARLARGHVGESQVSNWDIPALGGAGALRSSASDMLKFLAANMGLVQTSLFSTMQNTHRVRTETGIADLHVGLGWHVFKTGSSEIVWHNGGTGGYRSFAGFNKQERYGVVVLTNSARSADDIGLHILDPGRDLQSVRVPVAIDRSLLDRYVGRYRLRPGFILTVTKEGDLLLVQVAEGPLNRAIAESETRFSLTAMDARITFMPGESGEATSLVLHQGGRELTATRID